MAILLLIQILANTKAREDGPKTWAPATHLGDSDGSSGLLDLAWLGPAPTVAGNLGKESADGRALPLLKISFKLNI